MPMDILALLNTGMLRESWTIFSCSSSDSPVVQTTMQLVSLAVGQCLLDCRRGAEVDDDITFAVQLVQTVVYRDAVQLAVLHVDTGHDAAILPLGDHLAQHMAHPAADALNDNIGHCQYPLFSHTAKCPEHIAPGILHIKSFIP